MKKSPKIREMASYNKRWDCLCYCKNFNGYAYVIDGWLCVWQRVIQHEDLRAFWKYFKRPNSSRQQLLRLHTINAHIHIPLPCFGSSSLVVMHCIRCDQIRGYISLVLSETLQVMKTFHFHKLKYLFQRFRCSTHPFSRTTYDILHLWC